MTRLVSSQVWWRVRPGTNLSLLWKRKWLQQTSPWGSQWISNLNETSLTPSETYHSWMSRRVGEGTTGDKTCATKASSTMNLLYLTTRAHHISSLSAITKNWSKIKVLLEAYQRQWEAKDSLSWSTWRSLRSSESSCWENYELSIESDQCLTSTRLWNPRCPVWCQETSHCSPPLNHQGLSFRKAWRNVAERSSHLEQGFFQT